MRFTPDATDAAGKFLFASVTPYAVFFTVSNLFMVNACPTVAQQSVAARIRGLPSRVPLLDMYETPLQRQRCGITVRPSTNFVTKVR